MNCATCKVKKIGPKTAPFGGYLCGNEHLQCNDCNQRSSGQCGVCEDGTSFVQMNLRDSMTQSSPVLPDGVVTPTAPPKESTSNLCPMPSNTSYLFPKAFFADIETQSSISQEELSMHDSQVSIITDRSESKQHALSEKPPMLNKSFTKMQESAPPCKVPVMNNKEHAAQMETIFFGHSQQQHSASNFTFIPYGMGDHGVEQLRLEGTKLNIEPKEIARETQEDTEDPNVIHTSEIRFMESTESLKNYYSGGTMHPNLKQAKQDNTSTNNHQETLSVRMLHDFESQNSANPVEMVENYLRSYGPLAVCHFPAYSFNHNCYHPVSCEGWTPQQRQALMRSICVSTESEPSLAGQSPVPRTDCTGKYLHPDFFVMQATVVAEPPPSALLAHINSDKSARSSLDQRMQKVLGTFQEDPRQPAISEKPLLEQSKNFIKVPTAEPSLPLEAPQVPPIETHLSVCEIPEKTSHDLATQLSNSHRAFYNPPSQPTVVAVSTQSMEPPPQFQLISCSTLIANDQLIAKARNYMLMKPMPACMLRIPRSPIRCPESTCTHMIFVSDFNKHMVVDHTKLPMERISPRQCKNFFLDPRVTRPGASKCHLLYLIRDKITDLGSSKYKDFLPLLVMSTRVRLADLCGGPVLDDANNDINFLMVWLTGIVPEQLPIYVSLTVWPRSGQIPACHVVHSGEMYSIRNSQVVSDVCQSGQMLLLSENELKLLTRDGKDMLELQIVVH